MPWYGDPKGHALAGSLGGKAQGKRVNSGNFANNKRKASLAGRKGGKWSPKAKRLSD